MSSLSHQSIRLLTTATATAVGITLTYIAYNKLTNYDKNEDRNSDIKLDESASASELVVASFDAAGRRLLRRNTITIAYASTTGTCQNLARELTDRIGRTFGTDSAVVIQCLPMNEIDFWDEFLNAEEEEEDQDLNSNIIHENITNAPPALILLIPTWTNGAAPPSALNLFTALDEVQTDWRVASYPLASSKLHVAAFGMGSTEYDASTFCKPVKDGIASLIKLGATALPCGVGMGDGAWLGLGGVGRGGVAEYTLLRCVALRCAV